VAGRVVEIRRCTAANGTPAAIEEHKLQSAGDRQRLAIRGPTAIANGVVEIQQQARFSAMVSFINPDCTAFRFIAKTLEDDVNRRVP
jgi:hypothetical protein